MFDLPASVQQLVYDFGKLTPATEKKYTIQMVKNRCSTIQEVEEKNGYVSAIADVIAWSQDYMKGKEVYIEINTTTPLTNPSELFQLMQDECSFVSLRDVDRTLAVFTFFCEKWDKFHPLIEKIANGKVG